MSHESHVRAALDLLLPTHPKSTAQSLLMGKSDGALPDLLLKLHSWVLSSGVVGIGVAEKETCGKRLPDIVLKVYVEKKTASAKTAFLIPKSIDLPGLPTIYTDVVGIGAVELHGVANKPGSYTQRVRPAIPGYSIGIATEPSEAGTFGMLVQKKGQPSAPYVLSNSHAIASSGFAALGTAIIQPGGYDGGVSPADDIAALSEFVPFVFDTTGFTNLVDAAIAQVTADDATAAIAQLGVPTGVNTNLKRGMVVQKVGRTTTRSLARVDDVDLRISATYPNPNLPAGYGRVGFSDQVLVTFYSAGGDSGSSVLDLDNNVVGLHWGGSATNGMFCKIQNVMDLLGVEVVASQNGATTQGKA